MFQELGQDAKYPDRKPQNNHYSVLRMIIATYATDTTNYILCKERPIMQQKKEGWMAGKYDATIRDSLLRGE